MLVLELLHLCVPLVFTIFRANMKFLYGASFSKNVGGLAELVKGHFENKTNVQEFYVQSKRAGIIYFIRPPINLRSNKKVKFKKGTKHKNAIHLKSPRVCGVKVWDMLPATV